MRRALRHKSFAVGAVLTGLLVALALLSLVWRPYPPAEIEEEIARAEAAIAAGISRTRVQLQAVLFAGLMAGLAGATLVLAQAGTFVEGMSAGRGFIAIAIVVIAWNANLPG